MEILRKPDKEGAKQEAIASLSSSLKEFQGKPILFLVSGGSALELLNGVKKECITACMCISVLDERYTQDPAVSNFAQLVVTQFYQRAKANNAVFVDTRVQESETLEGLANRFERSLRNWKKENPQGVVIITQGMGSDGHTSGMMPYPENPEFFERMFEDSEHWVAGYDAGDKNEYPLRVTTTMPFLRSVDYSIAYATGENKRSALQRVLAEGGTLAQTPSRIVREMKSVKFFTDLPE